MAAQLSLDSTVGRSRAPIAADVAGETVLMSIERSNCYGLGKIGSEIWEKLSSPVRIRDLVNDLALRYEAGPGEIERDVLSLLQELASEGLIDIR